MRHGNIVPVQVLQARIEREPDFVPNSHIAGRLALLVQMAAFQIAEIADVVNRRVAAADLERLLTRARERCALGEEWIKNDPSASVGFAPRPTSPYSTKCSNSHW